MFNGRSDLIFKLGLETEPTLFSEFPSSVNSNAQDVKNDKATKAIAFLLTYHMVIFYLIYMYQSTEFRFVRFEIGQI